MAWLGQPGGGPPSGRGGGDGGGPLGGSSAWGWGGTSALVLAALAALAALPRCADDPGPGETPPVALAELLCDWEASPQNPLVEPPGTEFLIGDPTVLRPDEAPDGQWHLFANSLLGIHHYTSEDGLDWVKQSGTLGDIAAFRPFVFIEDGTYYLFYEQFRSGGSEIRRIDSTDLVTWSEPLTVLRPELDWEETYQSTVGNPYVMRRDDDPAAPYWLYYSADGALLEDTGFPEPRVIGLARAPSLDGPWTREAEPLIVPSAEDPWRNLGAGSLKLLDETVGGRLIALNNGIYQSEDGVSGSAIRVLSSADGLVWADVCGAPVLAPDGEGWDAAFVYAFDTARVGDTLRVYYNARDGYAQGTERIGMATQRLPLEGNAGSRPARLGPGTGEVRKLIAPLTSVGAP